MDVYDRDQSWQWNLDNAPSRQQAAAQHSVDGSWSWCGLPASSPLGVPAGPLLNTRWLLYYADRGFDILVYKTVRSNKRDCYSLPNLVPVEAPQLSRVGEIIPSSTAMSGSWAVSYGMPSQEPGVWREDVAFARKELPVGKLLVVSVVGTQDESLAPGEAALEQLADDFAQCAQWAMNSGAHGVEANFSCPNVSTADGQLYQQPAAAGFVAERIRDRIGSAPLVLKIGYSASQAEATELLRHVGPFVNGLAMTNSIAAKVSDSNGDLLFDGQRRGICGDAIRNASIDQVSMFRELLSDLPFEIDLIGVGGISTVEHVRDYLNAGATSVAIATAAMLNPNIALPIRVQLHTP